MAKEKFCLYFNDSCVAGCEGPVIAGQFELEVRMRQLMPVPQFEPDAVMALCGDKVKAEEKDTNPPTLVSNPQGSHSIRVIASFPNEATETLAELSKAERRRIANIAGVTAVQMLNISKSDEPSKKSSRNSKVVPLLTNRLSDELPDESGQTISNESLLLQLKSIYNNPQAMQWYIATDTTRKEAAILIEHVLRSSQYYDAVRKEIDNPFIQYDIDRIKRDNEKFKEALRDYMAKLSHNPVGEPPSLSAVPRRSSVLLTTEVNIGNVCIDLENIGDWMIGSAVASAPTLMEDQLNILSEQLKHDNSREATWILRIAEHLHTAVLNTRDDFTKIRTLLYATAELLRTGPKKK